jgi:hypothetical protein
MSDPGPSPSKTSSRRKSGLPDLREHYDATRASPGRVGILVFALLGALSGLISWIAASYLGSEWLRFSFIPFGWRSGAAPIMPGIVFGLLVAACCNHYGGKDKIGLALAVLVTIAAWILAYDLTVLADERIGGLRRTSEIMDVLAGREVGGNGSATANGFVLGSALSFGLGGLIGGAGTARAAAAAHPAMRRGSAFALTVAVGTLFGAIEKVYDFFGGELGLILLFVCWQAAVIASIARGLSRE